MLRKPIALLALLPLAVAPLALACGAEEPSDDSPEAAETAERDYAERMREEHAGDRPVESPAAEVRRRQRVHTFELVYADMPEADAIGYLTRPRGARKRVPGVLMIHEWWGLNDNIKRMAQKLAVEEYAVLAVDLFDRSVAETPDSAMSLVRNLDAERARTNLRRANAFLREKAEPRALRQTEPYREPVGAGRVGVIGWCFGGGWALRAALDAPGEIDAVVIYYGQLETDPERLARLNMPVLGHFGAEDESIPLEQVRRFETVLDSLGIPNEIHVYEGAGHAFANPSGTRYVEEAAERAWSRTLDFFRRHLKEAG